METVLDVMCDPLQKILILQEDLIVNMPGPLHAFFAYNLEEFPQLSDTQADIAGLSFSSQYHLFELNHENEPVTLLNELASSMTIELAAYKFVFNTLCPTFIRVW